MLPSEEDIKAKLIEVARPAPGRFQRLAEDFLSLRDPERYGRLRPQGRNPSDQTTKGYPDAYAVHGTELDVVEVTVGDWRKHVENEDLKRLSKLKGARSYVLFVLRDAEPLIPQSNSPEEKRDKDEEYFRSKIGALGIPADRIEFIFLGQLVRELRSFRYAGLLRELGLEPRLEAFTAIKDYVLPDADAPRKDEFMAAKVVAPERLAAGLQALRQHRCLFVVGAGASGKTTLGLAIAFSWCGEQREAYFADAREFSANLVGFKSVAMSVASVAKSDVLLVIDNVHLLTTSEQHQLLKLATESSSSRTVLLSRRHVPSASEQLPLKVRERFDTQEVKTSEADLEAAYKLLASRENKFGAIPRPSKQDLHGWMRTAPDLLIFSTAVRGQKAKLRAGVLPHVTEGDAIAYLQREYVRGLGNDELNSLTVISKLAELEIPASSKSLNDSVPVGLVQTYKVIRTHSQNGTVRYSLPHDNLGALILRCISSERIDEQWQAALARDSFQAAFVARRLLDASRASEARDVLWRVETELWKFDEEVPPSFAHAFDQLYVRAGMPLAHRARAVDLFNDYVDGVEGFLNGASSFLRYCSSAAIDAAPAIAKLMEISEERFCLALKHCSPYELTDLARISALVDDGLFKRVKRLLDRTDVGQAFANHFLRLSREEANSTLVNLVRFLPDARVKLVKELTRSSEVEMLLGPLPAVDTVRSVLRLREFVELIAEIRPQLLLDKIRAFSVLRELTERFAFLGPNSRNLVQAALRTLDPQLAYCGQVKRDVDVFTQVITVAGDSDLLELWIRSAPQPAERLMLFWRPETFVSLFESLTRRFGSASPLVRSLRRAAETALNARLATASSEDKKAALVATQSQVSTPATSS